MKHQFLKIAAASPELRVADPAFNAAKIAEVIEEQSRKGTELLVFPELSLSGYTCGDLFLQKTLLDGCLGALDTVAKATEGKTMLVFVGLPVADGEKLYNCAAAVNGGKVLALIAKSYLPDHNEFYEGRHFSGGKDANGCVRLHSGSAPLSSSVLVYDEKHPEICVACEICEDLWVPVSPSTMHCKRGAAVVVNLSASNELIGKREYRRDLLAAQSGKNLCAYVYCCAGIGESTSDMVFAGNHMIYENGVCLAESKPFSGEVCEAEADVGFLLGERRRETSYRNFPAEDGEYIWCPAKFVTEGDLTLRKIDPAPFVPKEQSALFERAELILSMQAHALARRIRGIGAKTVVLGVSGGLDSTLALLVCRRAVDLLQKDPKTIYAYTMPGFGTTEKTKSNADRLMEVLGVTAKTVPISETVLAHFKDIGHDPAVRDSAYENAQARYRTMILMDVANETGGLAVGTGDLSELALGWCTYNGDHMSMYAVNCSVPKTLVRHLVRAEGKRLGGEAEEILESVLNTAISPELLPPDEKGEISQKTEDLIGPYELTDFYLYHFLRRGDGPAKTLYLAERAFAGKYSRAVLKKWLVRFYRRFFSQQFKRNCVPDGVKIGSVSLSPRADLRMPSDASAALWIGEAESL